MESSLVVSSQPAQTRRIRKRSNNRIARDEINFHLARSLDLVLSAPDFAKGDRMTGRMPPIPPANRSTKGKAQDAEAARDTSHKKGHTQNPDEQGDTANIKQNTTNAGFFKGRRVK